MDWMILVAQGRQLDLASTTAPVESWAGWWPVITTVITLIIGAIATAFTAWQKLRERRIEHDSKEAQARDKQIAENEKSKLQLELQELKSLHDSRQQMYDAQNKQILNLSDEARKLRDELRVARESDTRVDAENARLVEELAQANAKCTLLNAEVSRFREDIDELRQKLKDEDSSNDECWTEPRARATENSIDNTDNDTENSADN